MILVDHFLQLGLKEVPYYNGDIDALIDDIGKAFQIAIKDLYDHGCRYLQIDDTSWKMCIRDSIWTVRSSKILIQCFLFI